MTLRLLALIAIIGFFNVALGQEDWMNDRMDDWVDEDRESPSTVDSIVVVDDDCIKPEITQIWAWRWFGALSWLRLFDGVNFFVYAPLAISWTVLHASNKKTDKTFLWLNYRWAGILGWITSGWQFLLGVGLLIPGGSWWKDHMKPINKMGRTEEFVYGSILVVNQLIG